MKNILRWTTLAALVAFTVVGCEPPKPPPPAVAPQAFVVPESRSDASVMMKDHTAKFRGYVDQMPGASGGAHRQLLAQALSELWMHLKLANGPVESPEFSNALSVIYAAAKTANMASIPRERMEAVENEALTAAHQALVEISTRYLFQDTALPALLEMLNDKVSIAAGVVGPMHDLDATEAFRAMVTIVYRVTNDMLVNFTNENQMDDTPGLEFIPPSATTAPATMP